MVYMFAPSIVICTGCMTPGIAKVAPHWIVEETVVSALYGAK